MSPPWRPVAEARALSQIVSPRVRFLCVDATPRHVLLGANTGTVYVFARHADDVDGKLRFVTAVAPDPDIPSLRTNAVRRVALHPNGWMCACAYEDGMTRVWAIPDVNAASTPRRSERGGVVASVEPGTPGMETSEDDEVTTLAWSPDGSTLVVGDRSGRVRCTGGFDSQSLDEHEWRLQSRGGTRRTLGLRLKGGAVASLEGVERGADGERRMTATTADGSAHGLRWVLGNEGTAFDLRVDDAATSRQGFRGVDLVRSHAGRDVRRRLAACYDALGGSAGFARDGRGRGFFLRDGGVWCAKTPTTTLEAEMKLAALEEAVRTLAKTAPVVHADAAALPPRHPSLPVAPPVSPIAAAAATSRGGSVKSFSTVSRSSSGGSLDEEYPSAQTSAGIFFYNPNRKTDAGTAKEKKKEGRKKKSTVELS